MIRSDPKVRPVYEDFAQPIGQDGTRAYLNEDAGASGIKCLTCGRNCTGRTKCSTSCLAMAFDVLGYGPAVVFEKTGIRGVLSFIAARNFASGF